LYYTFTKMFSDRMKSLNAKRVAAIAAGAALLGMGLACAGTVYVQGVPIIVNGQPNVQVVIGSGAKASDGVAAANIAAAIGNLAYTSVPVTAQVNTTQANKVLKVSVSSSKGVASNPQVWLNESGSAAPSGAYAFTALIGSVLNAGVQLGSPANTKLPITGISSSYTYPVSDAIGTSPLSSPYYALSSYPPVTILQNTYGGGIAFSTFRNGNYDNIMEVANSNLPALLTNSGAYGENEYLWLTGVPVFDQGTASSPVNQFAIASAGGAYQVTFNKPIPANTANNGINQPTISLFGQSWTILNTSAPSSGGVKDSVPTGTTDVFGGAVTLAGSLSSGLQTVYVLHNITSGPISVQLSDLETGTTNFPKYTASLTVYYKGVPTGNVSQVYPPGNAKFNVSGQLITVRVNNTYAGLYQYQRWATMQIYTNTFPLSSGTQFNATTDPGWYTLLGWTNSTGGGKTNALQTIIVYNQTPTTILKGSSFGFIESPEAYKMTLAGDTLGNNYDDLVASVAPATINYQNAVSSTADPTLNDMNNITEPAQLLTVQSSIPDAFTYTGGPSQSVVYNLVPYSFTEVANALTANGASTAVTSGVPAYLYAWVTGPENALINTLTANQFTVTVYGAISQGASPTSAQGTFTSGSSIAATQATADTYGSNVLLSTNFYNVTKITVNEAIPNLNIAITSNSVSPTTNVLATFAMTTPKIIYKPSTSQPYVYATTAASGVSYNQQNGQPTSSFTLSSLLGATTTYGSGSLPMWGAYTYTMAENPVPGVQSPQDVVGFQLMNSTAGGGAAMSSLFQMNYSTLNGKANNVSYTPTSGAAINVRNNFVTERGSKIASIGASSIDFDLAKAVDTLAIDVGTVGSNVTSTTYKLYPVSGPGYGIDQPTNLPNVTIGKVVANETLGTGSVYSITGISNLTATPSVSMASTPVLLKNLSTTTPLVVLDSQASQGSNLILIGSGFVNTLSAQLQSSYNIPMTATSPMVMQAYGANRILIAGYYAQNTTAASNEFIQQLYAQAAAAGS
jgi:hypothetical protein